MTADAPRHLLTLAGLAPDVLRSLLDGAARHAADMHARMPAARSLAGLAFANVFLEPSTRTRVSFELAAGRLGADVVNLDVERSSAQKGETLLDTVRTLHAMRVELFAVRHADDGELAALAASVAGSRLAVVSAGEGTTSHPTQGLIDALTLQRHFGGVDGLDIAIVGDIAHSRVARSAVEAFTTLGAGAIRIAGPDGMLPAGLPGTRRCASMDEALDGADVVMMLRVQRERIAGTRPDMDAYRADWALTEARLERASPRAVVMHPGPVNRGVEIDPGVADGPRSLILAQAGNGVPVRMAVLEWLAAGLEPGV